MKMTKQRWWTGRGVHAGDGVGVYVLCNSYLFSQKKNVIRNYAPQTTCTKITVYVSDIFQGLYLNFPIQNIKTRKYRSHKIIF